MNRGRHRKKSNNGYPPEVNQLLYPEVFKKAFTPEQTRLLLRRQADVRNPSNLNIFEVCYTADKYNNGFNWSETKEGYEYWDTLLRNYNYIKLTYIRDNKVFKIF